MLSSLAAIGLRLYLLLLSFLGLNQALPQTVIRGAVIPHHEVAVEFIRDLGRRLAPQSPPRIFIISPNHQEIGLGPVLTDQPLFADVARVDPATIAQEHGYQVPKKILSEFLPHTQFIPLVVSSHLDSATQDQLVQELSLTLAERDVLVTSTDFSHYRNLATADAKDQVTQKLIQDRNYAEILKLNNDYLDSPRSLEILMKTMATKGITTPDFVNHSNSAIISADPGSLSTTSYFEILYRANLGTSAKTLSF
ncbi:AmmeMemoRadiSam system protein B [Patescibacteria group bacterium]|nr:AmmeMemoRadiSam system protein B [Patescibacteria group bacterium]